ncbi:HNH endonuclease family protein [Cellulomonas sp. ATA003]|uniref:HNH endonuclease family protein n=1 Tax=Cellulomonas sp. ATA003 TaxID=3073064 RepID=UPI002873377B|nr:HNH endonuclease family protein [Cellulomonas sp. ATA003]WNB85546.1 HNH endonuclease family protein [Cellulomonas sp. ATA003]
MPPAPPRRARRRAVSVVVYLLSTAAVVVGVLLAWPGLTSGDSGPRYPVTAAEITSARAALDALEVKGRAPRTGYERELFGPAWADVDRNGCDTRNDVLARDLVVLEVRPGTGGCVVQAGTLQDPYSGRPVDFVRGADTSAEVQIDHVVALSDAWQKGAQAWDPATRAAFANDLRNLLAVDGDLNQAKGAGDAATWLPPHRPFRCRYVMRQAEVKAAYGLWVTAAERDAVERELDRCEVVEPPTSGVDAETRRRGKTPSGRGLDRVAAIRSACSPPARGVRVVPGLA